MMPPGNPLGYLQPEQRAALFAALGIPPTDANLGATEGYGQLPSQGSAVEPQLLGSSPQDSLASGLALLNEQEPPVAPVEPRKINPLQLIAGALADALGAKGAVLGGRVAPPSVVGQLRERREAEARRKTDEARYEQQRKGGERRAKAGALIEVGVGREARGAAATEAGLERSTRVSESALDRDARIREAADRRAHELEMAGREETFRLNLLREEGTQRRAAAKLDNKFGQGRDEALLTQLDTFVGGDTGNALAAAFDAAAADPAALKRLRDSTWRTAQATLRRMHTEDGYNEAEALITSEILPLLEEADAKLEQSQQPPTSGGNFPSPLGAAAGFMSPLLNLAPLGPVPAAAGMLGTAGAFQPGLTPAEREALKNRR